MPNVIWKFLPDFLLYFRQVLTFFVTSMFQQYIGSSIWYIVRCIECRIYPTSSFNLHLQAPYPSMGDAKSFDNLKLTNLCTRGDGSTSRLFFWHSFCTLHHQNGTWKSIICFSFLLRNRFIFVFHLSNVVIHLSTYQKTSIIVKVT